MPDANSPELLLRFVHISDTHLSNDPDYTQEGAPHTPLVGALALVEQINALPFAPDFVLHTGDVAYEPDPTAYLTAREVLERIRFPVYYLAGNHDDPAALQRMMLGREDILTPFHYEFEVNGVQIVCVDSNGPAKQPAGSVTAAQLAWLEGICAADDERPLVVAVHHNVLPIGIYWWDTFMRMTNGQDFHRALLPGRKRLRGVFHGHVHQPVEQYRDGILYASAASSWYQIQAFPGQTDTIPDPQTPPGFNVVTVMRDQTFIRRHHFQA